MWLIDTRTHQLQSFHEGDIPKYAILSHRWRQEEISFANLRDCHMINDDTPTSREAEENTFPFLRDLRTYRTEKLRSKTGWKKIEHFCQKAQTYHLDWAWVDTVCIDRSSSAELQESVNSMFKWYQNAAKCFIYMHDVIANPSKSSNAERDLFKSSEWFTRGWTLQELIAPPFGNRIFLDKSWNQIGQEIDFIDDISSVTGVPHKILLTADNHDKMLRLAWCSVAERLSWAAKRKVTRGEDSAYSLLGLFGINMTMLYGEGSEKAFRRLQLEIMKEFADETMLAWKAPNNEPYGISDDLARSPRDFLDANDLGVRGGDVLTGNKRQRGVTATPRGMMIQSRIIDRQAKSTPSKLLTLQDWTTRFAVPICVRTSPAYQANDVVVFLQLDHWMGPEFTRSKDPFCVALDVAELAQLSGKEKFESICIRSTSSLAQMT